MCPSKTLSPEEKASINKNILKVIIDWLKIILIANGIQALLTALPYLSPEYAANVPSLISATSFTCFIAYNLVFLSILTLNIVFVNMTNMTNKWRIPYYIIFTLATLSTLVNTYASYVVYKEI